MSRVLGDAGEYIGEPSLRIDVIHLRGHDQRRHHGSAVGAAFGASEQPRLPAESKSAERPFGRVVNGHDARDATPERDFETPVKVSVAHRDWGVGSTKRRQAVMTMS